MNLAFKRVHPVRVQPSHTLSPEIQGGITFRELAAMHIAASMDIGWTAEVAAAYAVQRADALIAELERTTP